MPSINLATTSKSQNQTHTLNYPVAHTRLLTNILALPLILQVALHKSENKSTVKILALYSVKIISHINRIKANLDIEGKGIDWFSNISQNQDFVLLGPRTLQESESADYSRRRFRLSSSTARTSKYHGQKQCTLKTMPFIRRV